MTSIADPIDYLLAQNDTVIDALCAYLIDDWNAPNTARHARELGVAGILEADAEKHAGNIVRSGSLLRLNRLEPDSPEFIDGAVSELWHIVAHLVRCPFCLVLETHHDNMGPYPCDPTTRLSEMALQHERDRGTYAVGATWSDGWVITRAQHAPGDTPPAWFGKDPGINPNRAWVMHETARDAYAWARTQAPHLWYLEIAREQVLIRDLFGAPSIDHAWIASANAARVAARKAAKAEAPLDDVDDQRSIALSR